MEVELFLPPYLQQLGYERFAPIAELGRRSVIIHPTHIDYDKVWHRWRGIFEYVSCVEFARHQLHLLPTGRALGSIDVVPARYHSASIVFFAQATLDNVAVWLTEVYGLNAKGSDCAFHKSKFINSLKELDATLSSEVGKHESFIKELEIYRQEWIHRLSGGARIFSDKSSEDPTAKMEIAVPINPAIDFEGDNKRYLQMIEKCRQKNKGRWLYSISEFADLMADGTRDLLIDILQRVLILGLKK